MSHTPGPWKTGPINYADVYAADGELVALVPKRFDENEEIFPETLANARLIAAAPDILRALKYVRNYAHVADLSEETMQSMDAAIAKAEGRV